MYSRGEIGALGEDIACRFLGDRGHEILERNYLRKWGEIDIVAKRAATLHFVEVKTVTQNFGPEREEDGSSGKYRAEDNVHPGKLRRMRRVIQTYLVDREKENLEWQFDVITVELNLKDKVASCNYLKDIVL